MTYKATVKNGVVMIPPDAAIADGTEVEVTVRPCGIELGQLLKHAGTWEGDDAEEIIDLIYRSRSSRDPVPTR